MSELLTRSATHGIQVKLFARLERCIALFGPMKRADHCCWAHPALVLQPQLQRRNSQH